MAVRGGLSGTLLLAAGLTFFYASFAFLWSGLGFASPTTPVHFHEYALPALVQEVGGHILFGVAASALTLDLGLVLLAAGESVLIDSDHLLAALNHPVEGRLAHSIAFALVAAVLLAYLARKSGGPGRGVFLVTLSAWTAHLGYDVLAGNGAFPILTPASFTFYSFPAWTWPVLLALAILLGALAGGRVDGLFRGLTNLRAHASPQASAVGSLPGPSGSEPPRAGEAPQAPRGEAR